MKIRRLISPLVLCLLLLFFCQAAEASNLTLDHQELKAIFTDIQLKNSPWPAEDLEITDFSSSPSRITVPMGTIDYELINQNHDKYLGQKSISVLIKVDGVPSSKVKMRGNLELYGNVVLINRRLGRRDIISNDDLSVARRNITMFSHELVTSPKEAVGQIARTTLGPGTVLLKQYLEKQPLVKRGDLVTITARTESVQVSTKGEARSEGAEGDFIQVKNLSSRQIITAQVVDQGLVRVDL
ncbi:MAG: flagellar basal body P-ring formation chaperone FlgA [Proteobacteria bacterium]|nr:flagellar basal body P-ring formation chaperone FlgA [Pseudomonadota bacterium]MBU1639863.1 flagellar basal body P-ring formation chaperone FlgA [Pseudomonadota bacterium]